MKKQFTSKEAAKQIDIEHAIVIEMIEQEWVLPIDDHMLDEEDIARIRLILDLRHQFGANDNAIPVILHLMDQLYYIRSQLSLLDAFKNK